jgi:Zn-dependent peptidase ImmA (M78 family)
MCEGELKKTGFLPASPCQIRIDRFIEKRFGVSLSFDDLPEGIVGLTCFNNAGVASVHVSRALVEEGTLAADRRVSSTLAHEAGHGLMHAHLFAFKPKDPLLFKNDPDIEPTKVMCRGDERDLRQKYNGKWWEHQANMAIGSLLLPASLVESAISPFLTESGLLCTRVLDPSRREEASIEIAKIFNVNPPVARYRLERLFCPSGNQPWL